MSLTQVFSQYRSWEEREQERVERETAERFAKLETAHHGQPATHCIGSDSYAFIVERVERFKSGARAGQVSAVIAEPAEYIGDELRAVPSFAREALVFRPNKRGVLVCAKYHTLWLGEARTYLDPHF
jgi:hypothetical protein